MAMATFKGGAIDEAIDDGSNAVTVLPVNL